LRIRIIEYGECERFAARPLHRHGLRPNQSQPNLETRSIAWILACQTN
jgi:hypothetical protein